MNASQDETLRRIAAINPVPASDELSASGPMATALKERILTCTSTVHASDRGRSHQHKRLLIGGGMLGVLVVGGAAAAVGLVPDAVTRHFSKAAPSDNTVTGARMVAEHISGNGTRDQVWYGHLRDGGQPCEYIRSVSADGKHEDGAIGCGPVVPAPPELVHQQLTVGGTPAGRPWPSLTYEVIVRTTLTEAARMDAEYPGGRSYSLTYNRLTGWAIGTVPPDVTYLDGVLVVRDTDGAVVAKQPIPATSQHSAPAAVSSSTARS